MLSDLLRITVKTRERCLQTFGKEKVINGDAAAHLHNDWQISGARLAPGS